MTCPCESHLSRTYVDRLFNLNVQTIYEKSFEDNDFTRAYHDSQGLIGNVSSLMLNHGLIFSSLIDYTYGEWKVNGETHKRERSITYRTVTHSILGTNTISCLEKQVRDFDDAIEPCTFSF